MKEKQMKTNRVWAVDVRPLCEETLFQKWYGAQRPARRTKIDRFRFESGKRQSLGAGIVMEKAFESAGFGGTEIGLSDEGKPFVSDGSCYFNLSHAGDLAVCAISDRNVGIDVERPREFNDAMIRYTFSDDEIRSVERHLVRLKKARSEGATDGRAATDPVYLRNLAFVRLWTIKESVMKWTGQGLGLSPKQIFVTQDGEEPHVVINHEKYADIAPHLHLFEYDIEEYHITVCSETSAFPDELNWVTL